MDHGAAVRRRVCRDSGRTSRDRIQERLSALRLCPTEGHALARKTVITAQDLDNVPFISMNRDHVHFRHVGNAFEEAGARFHLKVETRQFAPACIMVAEGAGVSIVSPIDAAEFAGRGLEIRPFEPAISFGLGILYPAHRPRSLLLSVFVEMFRRNLDPYRMVGPATAGESAACGALESTESRAQPCARFG